VIRLSGTIDPILAAPASFDSRRAPKSPLRRNRKFARRFNGIASLTPERPKILLSFYPKRCLSCAIPPRREGRIAIVTTREAEMRWTRMMPVKTNGIVADGESVWS
jgi:hypothetical protein